MQTKKITALFCAASILAAALATGCSEQEEKKKTVTPNERKVYSDDTPWYTMEYADIFTDREDEPDADLIVDDYLGRSNGKLVFLETIMFPVPEDELFTETEVNYTRENLLFVSPDGNIEKTVDLMKLLGDEGLLDGAVYFSVNPLAATDDAILLDCFSMSGTQLVVLDPESGELKESVPAVSMADEGEYYMSLKLSYGEGRYLEYATVMEGSSVHLAVNIPDDEGNNHITDLSSVLPGVEAYDMSEPIMVDDSHAVSRLKTIGQTDEKWIEIDTKTCEVTACTRDMSFLKGVDLGNLSYIPGYGTVALDMDSVNRIDMTKGSIEQIFSFDWCNINRSLLKDVEILDVTDDKLTFYVSKMVNGPDGSITYEQDYLTFNKCETNPNVGKTILDVVCLGGLSEAVAQAVCDFNESSSDYYLRISDKYDLRSYGTITSTAQAAFIDGDSMEMEIRAELEEGGGYDSGMNDFLLTSESGMSDALAMDLLAGTGPDIIIGGAGFSQLNNDTYLLDLSDFYDGLDMEFFNNIIDAGRTGDALYQIPLSFTLSGIVAENNDITSGNKGFSYDQYVQYVNEVCNGTDPMLMNRLDCLTAIVSSQINEFISDGDVDFDNDEFRAAVDYVVENVFDQVDIEDRYTEYGDIYRDINGLYQTLMWESFYEDHCFMGIPSSEARGPVIKIDESVAIAANTSSAEGCRDFVRFLLQTPAQEAMAVTAMPVNREAFDNDCALELNRYEDYYNYWSEEDIRMMGISAPDEADIESLRAIVESADRINTTDTTVMIIMREEIQAYLAGDKTLDEVIDIIDNRAQTYIDERG